MLENVKISDSWRGNAQRRIYVSLVSTWSKGQSSLNCFLDIYQCSKPKPRIVCSTYNIDFKRECFFSPHIVKDIWISEQNNML